MYESDIYTIRHTTEENNMIFSEVLNDYMQMLGISSTTLSERSEISTSSISRYRAGEREPAYDSKYLDQLIDSIYEISKEKNIEIDKDEMSKKMRTSLSSYLGISYDQYLSNLSSVMKTFDIKVNSIAKYLSYDPSHISKILSGQRRPGNVSTFTSDISEYLLTRLASAEDYEKLGKLLGNEVVQNMDDPEMQEYITYWIKNYTPSHFDSEANTNDATSFLKNLDSFNLEEYIRAIHFDDIKVPTLPLQIPQSKSYYGLEQFKEAEINFFKITALSKARGPITMYSDMPMVEMSKDKTFIKKWMFGLAAILRKGLTLNVVHKVDRPWEEMMLGLEAWVPIYMTGQIKPYYMDQYPTNVFNQLLNVSDACALQGEAVIGHHEEGKYYLTSKKQEVEYFRARSNHMLESCKPLMDIYNSKRAKEFHDTVKKITNTTGKNYKIISSSLPIYTISDELMDKVLNRAYKNDQQAKKKMMDFFKRRKKIYENVVKSNKVYEEIPIISKEEFDEHPMNLPFYGAFLSETIKYTYEEYLEHLRLTREYKTENLTTKETTTAPFRNIQILILSGKYVIVSKNTSPAIHFVIYHPRLVNAIENMTIPIND